MFLEQGGLGDDDFSRRLFLVFGDQLTSLRMRAVKTGQARAERLYDKRDWLLGIPAWFHIQLNLLFTIVRTHWSTEGAGGQSRHTLCSDSTTWSRTQTSRDNAKYHLLEPIVAQGFTSRVTALFYEAMKRAGFLQESVEDIASIDEAIGALTPGQFARLVEDIRKTAFTASSWKGIGHEDVEFRTMCRLLQEVALFLTVRHAVKHGDIGMLRRVVDPLVVVFFGAGQHNYGREMLYYRWLLSDANTPELQHAILTAGLVNWPGRATAHKPIDLSLEHLNAGVKIDMQCYKNSTHDVNIIFDRVCLCNTFTRELRQHMESAFSPYMPDLHTTRSAVLDMFSLARTLFSGKLAAPRPEANLHARSYFDSADIIKAGFEALPSRVETFNREQVRIWDRDPSDPMPVEGDEPSFVEVDASPDDLPDDEVDPTVDLPTAAQVELTEPAV